MLPDQTAFDLLQHALGYVTRGSSPVRTAVKAWARRLPPVRARAPFHFCCEFFEELRTLRGEVPLLAQLLQLAFELTQ